MSSERCALGIDVGGTHVRMGVLDEAGVFFAYEKHSSARLGPDPIQGLEVLISDYICRNGMEKQVCAVCIGLPATVDKKRERVLSAPNLRGLDGLPVGKLLSERLGLPVYLERDVNLLLLHDLQRMQITARDVIACYVGTGIGNAIMLDGKLHVGHNGVAGELGHVPFGDENGPCGCGNNGCAEPLAGGLYLAGLCREAFPDTPVAELFTRHAGHPLLARFIERLGRVIATEINILDPEVLLLGGGVIDMAEFPRAALESSIRAHTRKPLPHDTLRILYAEGDDGRGGAVGAGILAGRSLKHENCHR